MILMSSTFTLIPRTRGDPPSGTPVCGSITTDTTWSPYGSPYWVECDITVEEGVRLEILSDVYVKFNGYYSIYVEGELIMLFTTAVPPIVFTSNQSSPQIGDWRAIQFNSTTNDDNSTIVNSVIEYADYGIRLEQASPSLFWWDEIRHNTYGIYSYYSTPFIGNSTIIWNEEDGIYIDHLDPESRDPPHLPWEDEWIVPIYVEDSNVSENGEMGIRAQDSILNVSSSKVSDNEHTGIHLLRTNATVLGSDVSYNDRHGIYIDSSLNMTVTGSTFHHNTWDGISSHDSNSSTITASNFTTNYNAIYLGGSSWNLIDNNELWMYLRGCAVPPVGGRPPGESCGPGVVIEESSDYNTVSNNAITQTIGAENKGGVYIKESYFNTVLLNDFQRNENGVHVDGSLYTNVSTNDFENDKSGVYVIGNSIMTSIWNNDFTDEAPYSILLNHSEMTFIKLNKITTTSGRSGTGIRLMEDSLYADITSNNITKKNTGVDAITTKTSGCLVYGNNISDNTKGVQVLGSTQSSFKVDMLIRKNEMWGNDYGMYVSHAIYLEIDKNGINASSVHAIHLEYGSYVNITHNWIENNTYEGVFLSASGTFARIDTHNNLANNEFGVYLQVGANATINYNNIFGNTAYGVYNNVATSIPDATWNWWGDSNGPWDGDYKGCCGENRGTSGDKVKDDEDRTTDYCGSGSDWLQAKI